MIVESIVVLTWLVHEEPKRRRNHIVVKHMR
jgi:hypothetical protein